MRVEWTWRQTALVDSVRDIDSALIKSLIGKLRQESEGERKCFYARLLFEEHVLNVLKQDPSRENALSSAIEVSFAWSERRLRICVGESVIESEFPAHPQGPNGTNRSPSE